MEFTFKIGENIKKAWNLFKNNLNNIIIFVIVIVVYQLAINSILNNFKEDSWIGFFTAIVSWFISSYFSYLWIRATLDMIDGKSFNPFSRESQPTYKKFLSFILTTLVVSWCLLAVVGIVIVPILLLAVVFGIKLFAVTSLIIAIIIAIIISLYFMSRLSPAIYLSVDKDQGSGKNISESWRMTKSIVWNILGKMLLIFLFIIGGLFALGVGILITYPLGMILVILLYREVLNYKSNTEKIIPEIINEVPKPEIKIETETVIRDTEIK